MYQLISLLCLYCSFFFLMIRRPPISTRTYTHFPCPTLFLSLLARLEVRHVLARQLHRFAGLGVAADSRRTKMQREAAKTPDFDPFACGEREIGRAHV